MLCPSRWIRQKILLVDAGLTVGIRQAPHKILPLEVSHPNQPHKVSPGLDQLSTYMISKAPLLERSASALISDLVAEVYHLHDIIIAIINVYGLQIAAVKSLRPERACLRGQPLHVSATTKPLENKIQETCCEMLIAPEDLLANDSAFGPCGGHSVRERDPLARVLLAFFVACTDTALIFLQAGLVYRFRAWHCGNK